MSETPPPPPPPPPPPGGAVPPPGGYGGPPPPGQPSGQYNVGEAVSYGWAKFQANAAQIIIAGLVVFLGVVVFEIIGFVIRSILVQDPECTGSFAADNFECTDGSGFFVTLLASAIMAFLFYVVFQIIGAGVIRGALHITEGKPFVVAEIFKTDKIGPIIITSLISSVIILVGFVLCFLPGIVAAFFLQYALYFVIDKDQEPMEAIRSSFNFVKDNLANTVVWYLISLVVLAVGAILCGIGLIVAIPVSLIGTAYTYKLLTGQPIAA